MNSLCLARVHIGTRRIRLSSFCNKIVMTSFPDVADGCPALKILQTPLALATGLP